MKNEDCFYRWGSLIPCAREEYIKGKNAYEYWDAKNESYINIGDVIAGTEYDVAHAVLGGKWRIPTKTDVEELITHCTLNNFNKVTEYYNYDESGNPQNMIYANVGNIIGVNNSKIQMVVGSQYWTGTSIDGYPVMFYYTADYQNGDDVPGTGRIQFGYNNTSTSHYWLDREYPNSIRPVWDPNM